MYGKKVTNINRHKVFDPMRNIQRIEEAEAAQAAKLEAKKKRATDLHKEQLEERYESLRHTTKNDDGDVAPPQKVQRLEWMTQIPTPPQQAGLATSAPTAALSEQVVTGKVTDEEAAELRRQLDNAKKAKYDPLQRIHSREDQQVAMAAKMKQRQAGQQGQSLVPSFDKERALNLLKQANKLQQH